MRILKFKVIGQRITPDPACDFSNLVPGTKGYLQARFDFGQDWAGCRKVAAFWCLGKEYAARLENNECEIPAEALAWKNFEVSVTGVRPGGYRITTNKITVKQEG